MLFLWKKNDSRYESLELRLGTDYACNSRYYCIFFCCCFFCLHCNFLRPDSKDAISNETCTGALFFSTIHIHLLIHAHCISICFPPITSITQSQSLCEHIFHLSLFSLSFINLNISTPDDWFWTNTQQPRRRRACSVMCGVHFFLLAF